MVFKARLCFTFFRGCQVFEVVFKSLATQARQLHRADVLEGRWKRHDENGQNVGVVEMMFVLWARRRQ